MAKTSCKCTLMQQKSLKSLAYSIVLMAVKENAQGLG
jgi:hypothetical protein